MRTLKPLEKEEALRGKLQALAQSVSEVYKYELLTTNKYLKQMELVLEIFNELAQTLPAS